jgi:putative nucleotidyltransferase with HDIG domain
VDDEANILSALKRLFRPAGYRILTATSGKEGLSLIEQEAGQVDLVISDMRMPEMDGAAFLSQVRSRWPQIPRILLTGYADMDSTVAAINEGQIYRYISKPWNDGEVTLIVRDALERTALQREKERLEALTQQQNEELKALNAGLEDTVAKRTAELRVANDKLKRSFYTSVQVFANLIELRAGQMAGHSGRVADLTRKLVDKLGLKEKESQDIFLAALLHDIGKMGLPDELLIKPPPQMTGDEFAFWRRHPVKGEQALMALEELQDVAAIIRSHHERFDGAGYPDGLSGMAIPFGARVLAVVNEYDGLVSGALTGTRMSDTDARQFILKARGKRYDPSVVDAFLNVFGNAPAVKVDDLELGSHELRPGMVLARNVTSSEGVVLLTANYTLSEHLIRQLRDFEQTEGRRLTFYVLPPDKVLQS